MDELVESATKEVLVEMVKLAQKKKMGGSKGDWKEFLNVYDKKCGATLSDPSRRPVDSLIAFLKTFTEDADLKYFERIVHRHSKLASLASSSTDNDSAEQRLVRLTLEHPQYPENFFFPSYEEGWLVVKSGKKSKAVETNKIIAIDCEMVLCEDGTEAVVKCCVVDKNLEVKLDEVIHPNREIADYRTKITGISAENLVGVTRTLKDVQKSLKRLLSHGAILVGHGLNNDLNALKVDYERVIDTSYIFKYSNGPTMKKPSLSFLCKAMLNFELRRTGDPHNCFDDACAAMKLVLARLDGKIDGIIPVEGKDLQMEKLVIHRIPRNVTVEDLKCIVPGNFSLEVKANVKSSRTYTVTASFNSEQEAMEAFEKLDGNLEKDSSGRPQKLVKFQLESGASGIICVCKMGNADSAGVLTKKRKVEAETNNVSKKLRTDEEEASLQHDCSSECEIHLNEIEKLKKELSNRDQEITNLSKIITAFARRQGL